MLSRTALAAILVVSAASLVACAKEEGPRSVEALACEANPESPAPDETGGLRPKKLGLNRVSGNRIALNRIALNRIAGNRIALNKIALNRIALNRIALNKIALNRIALNGIELDGLRVKGMATASNELVGVTSEGQELRGESFVGATVAGILSDGTSIDLQITKFERTDDPAIVHYALTHEGKNLCEAGTGMFLPGTWDETGAYHATDAEGLATSYSCVDGVIGKCASWGYASWKAGSDSDLHAACTRMGTADYCGQGVSFTKDGTAIDMFDARGIQKAAGEADFAFEAAWGPNGAVCVSRPRYDAVSTSGNAMLPSCWSSLPTCDSWDVGLSKGASIGNASRPQSRTLCD
jgi:hypothetical protein